MTKVELMANIAKKSGSSAAESERVVDALIEVIYAETKKGQKVQVNGLGIFSAKKRAARMGINPKTKQKIKIAASVAPSFKAAKAFKDKLNHKK